MSDLKHKVMKDIRKDWTRWTKAERISVALIALVLTTVGPPLLVRDINSLIANQPSQIVRSR